MLRLVAEGLTNPEIGRRLYLSPSTVKHHVHDIAVKLRVEQRRVLLARRWWEHGE